jgi:hypothetical protein
MLTLHECHTPATAFDTELADMMRACAEHVERMAAELHK